MCPTQILSYLLRIGSVEFLRSKTALSNQTTQKIKVLDLVAVVAVSPRRCEFPKPSSKPSQIWQTSCMKSNLDDISHARSWHNQVFDRSKSRRVHIWTCRGFPLTWFKMNTSTDHHPHIRAQTLAHNHSTFSVLDHFRALLVHGEESEGLFVAG